VTAARSAASSSFELRYESLSADPVGTGRELASYLDAPGDELAAALGRAHRGSVGRYRDDLDQGQLADVEAEAGELLRELGYVA
jgi:hypothetical protein